MSITGFQASDEGRYTAKGFKMFITNIRQGYENEYREKILYAELRNKDNSLEISATLDHILLAVVERNLDVYNFKEAFRKYIDFQEQLRVSSITNHST